ncbi:MAG: hypothetical protein HFE61_08440 [Anaerotignum sp.]|jgi:hypothetical protein|nr:hypothetical protein [Anaerotignum sp.]
MAEKRGRKSKYETHVKPYFAQIQEWCRTMTEAQIAQKLGVGKSAFQEYKTKFPELAECLKNGRKNLVADLRGALIRKAVGYEYTEKKIVTERVKWPEELYKILLDAGLTPEQIEQANLVKTEVSHKKMAPDVAAINLALKNYDPENWANDPQVLALKKRELELRERQIEESSW